MRIIEINQEQYINYQKEHNSRNYYQSVEYANTKPNYKKLILGLTNDNDSATLLGAALILERKLGNNKIGLIPGGFVIDYNNNNLFIDFIKLLKKYLKEKHYIYVTVNIQTPYKTFDKKRKLLYFNTNIIKLLHKLSFVKIQKEKIQTVILEVNKNPNEIYKNFNNNTKRNIVKSLQRAITIYKDANNNIDTILSLNNYKNEKKIKKLLENFNTASNTAEIYFAKIDPEKYVNNYRFLLKNEDETNNNLNNIIQDINAQKSLSLIAKKLKSDKLINQYNNEIAKATNAFIKYPKGTIIGSIIIIKNNREIYFLDESYNQDLKKLYSSHLIKWEIMKKYLSEGYKIFNFGNIKNTDNNGDYLFKMGFGGKIHEYIGMYDLIINKTLYKITKSNNITKK